MIFRERSVSLALWHSNSPAVPRKPDQSTVRFFFGGWWAGGQKREVAEVFLKIVDVDYMFPPLNPATPNALRDYIRERLGNSTKVRIDRITVGYHDALVGKAKYKGAMIYYIALKDKPIIIAEPLNSNRLTYEELTEIAKGPQLHGQLFGSKYNAKVRIYADNGTLINEYDETFRVITPDLIDTKDQITAIQEHYRNRGYSVDVRQSEEVKAKDIISLKDFLYLEIVKWNRRTGTIIVSGNANNWEWYRRDDLSLFFG